MHARRPRAIDGDRGQSLVETALSLPLLLLILMGLVDFGRSFYYHVTISNAAREGAAYAARTTGATAANVAQIACNETGLAPYNAACPSALQVTYTAPANADWNASATVTVRYQMSLVSGYLVGRVFSVNPVTLRAVATFPLLR